MASVQELEKLTRIRKTFSKASGFLESQTGGQLAPEQPLVDLTNPSLVSFPPSFEPIPCKPIFFDLAGVEIDYPDLSSRTKKSGITGLLSSFWGR